MDDYRLAGFRIVGFPQASRTALEGVARRLLPHEAEILARWTDRQLQVWSPPRLEADQLRTLFGEMLHGMLTWLMRGQPERCITEMEGYGARLAEAGLPFEALMLSLHFLEESYTPYLLSPPPPDMEQWLIRIDEFLHVAIGAIASSYFEVYRTALLADAEIGVAIQESLSPHLPKRICDLEVGHTYISATERARLGGDFLDVFPLGGESAAFIIGDLAGHGLEAVIDAVTIRSLFRGFMRENPDLIEVLGRLNRVLPSELEPEQFATVLAGTYHGAGQVSLVSAGNPFPLLCDVSCEPVEHAGFPLSILDAPEYTVREISLAPGNLLVAYTDGLSEARDRRGKMFGDERVCAALAEVRDLPPRDVAEHLLDCALKHARGQVADDISVLVLKRAGTGE